MVNDSAAAEVLQALASGYHTVDAHAPDRAPNWESLVRRRSRRMAIAAVLSACLHLLGALALSVVIIVQKSELITAITADVLPSTPPKVVKRMMTHRRTPPPLVAQTSSIATPDPTPGRQPIFNTRSVFTAVTASVDTPTALVRAQGAPDVSPMRPPARVPTSPVATIATQPPAWAPRSVSAAPARIDEAFPGLSSVVAAVTPESSANRIAPQYLDAIRRRIEKFQRYPRFAREAGLEGTTNVLFLVRRDGTVSSVEVQGSSGSKVLDDAAVSAIREASPFPAFPAEQTGDSLRILIPVVFELKEPRGS